MKICLFLLVFILSSFSFAWDPKDGTLPQSGKIEQYPVDNIPPIELVGDSPICKKRKEAPLLTNHDIQNREVLLDNLRKQKLISAYSFFQTQFVQLKAMGLTGFINSKNFNSGLSQMLDGCSKNKPGSQFNELMSNLLKSMDGSTKKNQASQDLTKRYLMAFVEYQRIQVNLQDNIVLDKSARENLKKQQEKIVSHYPLVSEPFHRPQEIQVFSEYYGSLSRGRNSYEHMDEILFGNRPIKDLPISSAYNATSQLANALIQKEIPDRLRNAFVHTIEKKMRISMGAIGSYCGLNDCQLYDIDHHSTSAFVSAAEVSHQGGLMEGICRCDLDVHRRLVSSQITVPLGVGAAASGVGCLFGVAPFCTSALVLGGATAAAEGANLAYSIHQVGENMALKRVASGMPNFPEEELARLRERNQSIIADMALDLAIGLGGAQVAKIGFDHGLPVLQKWFRKTGNDTQTNTELVRQDRGSEGIRYQMSVDGEMRDVRMDATGYAISANNEEGRKLAKEIMESGNQSVIFVDVNNLGKINYFQAGTSAGDTYLASVAEEVAKSVGDAGSVFRWGGDEFVVVVNSTDEKTLTHLQTLIRDGVHESASAKGVFRQEKVARRQIYRSVKGASSFESLPESFVKTLTPAEVEFAKSDFSSFKARFVKIESQALYDLAGLRPSVSIGSARVAQGGAGEQALGLAEGVAEQSKIRYKSTLDQDVSKYQGRPSYLPPTEGAQGRRPRNLRTRPPILPPEN